MEFLTTFHGHNRHLSLVSFFQAMKLQTHTTALAWAGSATAMHLAQNADHGPASWCFTYLSDIIVPVTPLPLVPNPPVSLVPNPPVSLVPNPPISLPPGLSSVSQLPPGLSSLPGPAPISNPPFLTSSLVLPTTILTTTVSASPIPSAPIVQEVIFFIEPAAPGTRKRYVESRAVRGFLNTAVTGSVATCDRATVFASAQGQLSVSGGSPISYSPGDNYKRLGSPGVSAAGGVSTTFSAGLNGGILEFRNSSLPGGRANFCQDDIGDVYVTFTSSPLNCVPVSLFSYAGKDKDCPLNVLRILVLIIQNSPALPERTDRRCPFTECCEFPGNLCLSYSHDRWRRRDITVSRIINLCFRTFCAVFRRVCDILRSATADDRSLRRQFKPWALRHYLRSARNEFDISTVVSWSIHEYQHQAHILRIFYIYFSEANSVHAVGVQ